MIGFWVAGLLLSQAKPAPTRDMPLTIKPVSLPVGLQNKPLISISDVTLPKHRITRVFRYSFPAEYATVVAQYKKDFRAWEIQSQPGGKSISFERILSGKTIRYQAIVVNNTRLVRDEAAKTRSRPLWNQNTKGWVWISYNEGYESGKAPRD